MNLLLWILAFYWLFSLGVSFTAMLLNLPVEPYWSWRFVDRPRLKFQFQLELRDAWFGFFWNRTEIALHLYICVLPLIPLHITIARFL